MTLYFIFIGITSINVLAYTKNIRSEFNDNLGDFFGYILMDYICQNQDIVVNRRNQLDRSSDTVFSIVGSLLQMLFNPPTTTCLLLYVFVAFPLILLEWRQQRVRTKPPSTSGPTATPKHTGLWTVAERTWNDKCVCSSRHETCQSRVAPGASPTDPPQHAPQPIRLSSQAFVSFDFLGNPR